MTDYRGKTVSVIGLGISNIPLIGWLLDRGAVVTARDKKTFDDLPEAEIAKALETTVGAVKVRLHAARRKLKEMLAANLLQ